MGHETHPVSASSPVDCTLHRGHLYFPAGSTICPGTTGGMACTVPPHRGLNVRITFVTGLTIASKPACWIDTMPPPALVTVPLLRTAATSLRVATPTADVR